MRYGTADLVARFSAQAASEGYRSIKLHEITMPEIRAGRGVIDRGISFTVDVNCAWSEQYAAEVLPELADLDTLWLEEPVSRRRIGKPCGALATVRMGWRSRLGRMPAPRWSSAGSYRA